MHLDDVKKTTFKIFMENFYYTVIPFELKNVESTYQRNMTVIFHDIICVCLEDYVDD